MNYQCPEDEKTYLHRIGRTARAGAKGIAITFVDWDDMPRWGLIDKALDLGFGEPEETYSSSDHFYEELDIPRDVTGVLPRSQRTRAGLQAEEIEDLGETGRAGGARARTGGRGPDRSSDRPPAGRGRRAAATSDGDDAADRPAPRRRVRRQPHPDPWRPVAAGRRAALPRRLLPTSPRRPLRVATPPSGAGGAVAAAADRAARTAPPPRADRPRTSVSEDLDVLRRWETSGATWQVLAREVGEVDHRAAHL